MRLAIVSSHPIQYNAPWFRLLAQEADLKVKVFYTWSQSEKGAKYDPGFGKVIEWDIPLLEGYEYEFVENIAKDDGTHHFKGIDNPKLNEKIKTWKPDAILMIGWAFKSHLACMRYFKGRVPILFRGDSTLLDETGGIKQMLRRVFLSWVYWNIDFALYVGENNKKYFLVHGVREKQLLHAPHAIDNARFADGDGSMEQKAKEWRKKLGIAEDDFVVLFAGKLEAKKDPDFVLRLAGEVKDSNMKYIIVGNGPLEQELKAKAANDNRIIFIDFQNQQMMPVVYRLGDVFLLPSKGPGETWGLAGNEAMASSRPVIMSDKSGGAIDLLKKPYGQVIAPGDVDIVKRFIEELRDKRNEPMVRAAALDAVQNFSFSAIVSGIKQALSKIKNAA
jgi:glycosyltransferase involved in cell wall biosynthesis